MVLSRLLCVTVAAAVCGSALAQWPGIVQLGQGGEPTVTTLNNGTVYVTSHLPTQVFLSRDWGATYKLVKTFPESLGDMVGLPITNGTILSVFMPPQINGLMTRLSGDFGATWTNGIGIMGRPLDREWPAKHPSGAIYMVYSDGYIGGPDSKGIFISKSDDMGMSWSEVGRVDDSRPGTFAVDPHMVIGDDGTIHVLWTTSKDKNTIDEYKVASSTDGGRTFKNYVLLGTANKSQGDTQERWMLGGLAAGGKSNVAAFFVGYKLVDNLNTMQVFVRTSSDSGATYSPATSVVPNKEIAESVASYKRNRRGTPAVTWYSQCVAWADYDDFGKLHLVWYDNRTGQTQRGANALNVWHLRHTVLGDPYSEQVSKDFAAMRPPLDFVSCVADSKYVYATWPENDGSGSGWDFSGKLFVARKALTK